MKELLLWRKENKRWYEKFEISTSSSSLNALLKVPPPKKFSRPTGGAGSVAIHLKPLARNSIVSSPDPYISGPRSDMTEKDDHVSVRSARNRSQSTASSPEPLDQRAQKYRKPVFGEGVKEESRSSTRPSRRAIYRQSTLRGFSTQRAQQLVGFIFILLTIWHHK